MARSVTDSVFSETLKQWTGLDRAIGFTILGRFWSALASFITIFLITRFLSTNEQGYYYTFFSLVALQIVFELGFAFVILQLAAHERTHITFLPDGRLEGDMIACARLASILQKSIRWYSAAALFMAVALLPAGLYFFDVHHHGNTGVGWKGPWCLLVIFAALTFQIDPVFSFLEGCGFISQVARARLLQNMVGAALAWTVMLSHHGLFSPAMMIFGQALMGVAFLFTCPRRRLLTDLLRLHVGDHFVSWRREIWPFQWRIALSWLCGYFIFQLFTPVLFAYQGPAAAGRMGMSLTISSGIGSIAIAWMSTKASVFGNLIARGEISQLDKNFFTTLRQSTILLMLGGACFVLLLLVAAPHSHALKTRIEPLGLFVLLLVTTIVNHVISSEAIYLRAHKREPFLSVTIIVSLLLTASTLIFGRFSGAYGVILGYFVITTFVGLPLGTYVFVTKRKEWHHPVQSMSPFYEIVK